MAISKMTRVNLLAPDVLLDELLSFIQGLELVEVADFTVNQLNQSDEEQASEVEMDEEDAVQGNLINEELLAEYEERRHQIERAIEQAERYVPQPSLLEKLKGGKPEVSYRHIEFHGSEFEEKEAIEGVTKKINRLNELEHIIEDTRDAYDELRRWRNLDITPTKLNSFRYVSGVIGRVPSTNEDEIIHYLDEYDDLRYETVFIDENDYGVVVLSYHLDNSEILEALKEFQFIPFKYKSEKLPKEQLEIYEATINNAKRERQDILDQLKKYQHVLNDLKLQYEYVSNLTRREQAKQYATRSDHLVAIDGWVEAEHATHFSQAVQDYFDRKVVVRVAELNKEETNQAPTKLINNRFVRPYEMIVNMYGTPAYNEVDPTPYVMPFYAIFFGMMMADLGYGLLVALVGLIPLFAFNFEESTKNTLRLVSQLGLATMIWGWIYGSFFGITIESIQIIDLQGSVMEVMLFSMMLGVLHMSIGFVINAYLLMKEEKYAKAYSEGIHWLVLFTAIGLIAIDMLMPNPSSLTTVGVALIVLSFIGMFIANVIDAGSIAGLGAGLLGLFDAVSTVGDVLSYSRLMALGLSGLSIGTAFNMIIGQFPPVARFTIGLVLFIGLHLFNLFLSGLTGGVHALRLIFVEFFGKFYRGTGHEFQPLQAEKRYVNIKHKKKMEETL